MPGSLGAWEGDRVEPPACDDPAPRVPQVWHGLMMLCRLHRGGEWLERGSQKKDIGQVETFF